MTAKTQFLLYLQEKLPASAGQARHLEDRLQVKTFRRGQILLRPGEVCGYASFVARGCLRAYVLDDKQKEHVVQFAPENWIISDLYSLGRQQPASFFIDAIEDTEAVVLVPAILEEIFQFSGPAPFGNSILLNSFRTLQQRLISHLSQTAEARYEEFVRTYPNLLLRVPQHMIAAYLGITPQSLSRIRAQYHHR